MALSVTTRPGFQEWFSRGEGGAGGPHAETQEGHLDAGVSPKPRLLRACVHPCPREEGTCRGAHNAERIHPSRVLFRLKHTPFLQRGDEKVDGAAGF